MDEGAKKKLDQELGFLKESFDAEVISKEEYEKGKERIEKKLQGNGNNGNVEAIESQKSEKKEIEAKTESKSEETAITEAKKDVESQQLPAEAKELKEEGKKDNKIFKYAVVFVVLALIVFFGYSLLKQNKAMEKEETKAAQFVPMTKTKVTVLNDRNNCFNCGTERVLGIIESWFGPLEANEIDYNTSQGKEIADKFDLKALPAYIFDDEIASKASYNRVKQTFVMKNGNYLLSDNAAASAFYLRRENMPNRLDFFVKEGDASSIKAEKTLREFMGACPDVKFEKHSSTSELAKELGIKAFPAFLVINQVKFSGIHPSETIKDNFCSLNKAEECSKELSNNLI